ncbi:MAG: hypothetical protein K8T89_00530 [Planctomycetes bacterium]|nr:hypothetical protein [Planctomycetota bacterium]
MPAEIREILMWIGLLAIIAIAFVVVDRLVRWLINRFTKPQEVYPHRVATELPRVLHKADHDEIVDMVDDKNKPAK